ncbi:TraB/GumN family protein [Aurantimonas sp. MSK8Z-1]|uniref:TraB/GumN family protein n=1 Tax=Mangrovibrevibacter kandeliae TaxID=2968473 RepID=UPI0021196F45|nr:TraB/GumN family protein [Aurantimonas sp. MSK8Z-1]MCW4117108.1 TraB/GumN family protein [Aurantimonas sp. MSK8Z-1]
MTMLPALLSKAAATATAVLVSLPLLLTPALAAPPAPPAPAAGCAAEGLPPELTDPARRAALEAEAAGVPNGDGRFWRIERPGHAVSYLFGTMHLADPRVLKLPPAVEAAFEAAGTVVIETTDLLDQAASTATLLTRPDLLNLPAGKRLGDYMTPSQKTDVEAYLDAHGIPFGSIETLQPWLTSTSLMLPACAVAAAGADGTDVLDLSLAKAAEAAGKPVEGLETAAEQLEALASLPIEAQVETLVGLATGDAALGPLFEATIELYLAGHIAMITPLSEAAMPTQGADGEAGAAYAEFDERIVTRRNHVMAERLRPILAKGGVFVAVGALHLPGEEGLVESLRRDGWTVTRAD